MEVGGHMGVGWRYGGEWAAGGFGWPVGPPTQKAMADKFLAVVFL